MKTFTQYRINKEECQRCKIGVLIAIIGLLMTYKNSKWLIKSTLGSYYMLSQRPDYKVWQLKNNAMSTIE